MQILPKLDEARAYAQSGAYKVIPVSTEIYSDVKTPMEVLRVLKKVSTHCYMLESIEDNQNWGRYTFLGYDPKLELTIKDGVLTSKGVVTVKTKTDAPGKYIRDILNEYKSPRIKELPTFTGGLVGYFSYDYIKYAEPKLDLNTEDEEKFNDMDLMLFDKVIAFDHFTQKIILIVNIKLSELETEYYKAMMELKSMIALIREGEPQMIPAGKLTSEFHAMFDEAQYCEKVEKAKEYIKEGDIFQVVLSNRMEAQFEGSLFDTYRVLRTLNPSPYMFYFSSDDIEIAGASPETLVKLTDGMVKTFPLAGTRKRGATKQENDRLEKELLADEKECAEHNMLVDLGRNDLGKISEFGTVLVEKYMSVERFSHVMHLGSTVTGTIKAGMDAVDAIEAVLPAGTLSGAPKIRACEIIHELEDNKRGIYGGAIGYLDFAGNMDTCIAIRIAYKKNGKVFIRAGAGIVADSQSKSEYEECKNKAKAVVLAIQTAQGGLDA